MSDPTADQAATAATSPPTQTLDVRHAFRGFWDDGGVCRVRIFETEGKPPVVVVTELAENQNTSITNMAECLAPELVKAYLPHRMHESPPAVFLEHYDELLNARRRRSGPSVSRVSFTHYRPTIVNLGGVDRLTYGAPSWTHLDETALAVFLGDGVNLDES